MSEILKQIEDAAHRGDIAALKKLTKKLNDYDKRSAMLALKNKFKAECAEAGFKFGAVMVCK